MTGSHEPRLRCDEAGPPATNDGTAVRSSAPEPSRAKQGNALRAGVLGSTDGLVSNLSLVLGVAGSGAARGVIVVAGLAGLVAGSLSMALGEYLSVQSARELFANELKIEAGQLAASPDAEVAELRGIYERKGVPAKMAAELADYMVRHDSKLALDTMAREELGFDPNELGGSAWIAAGTSLVLFALGGQRPAAAVPRNRWPSCPDRGCQPQRRGHLRPWSSDHKVDGRPPAALGVTPTRVRRRGGLDHLWDWRLGGRGGSLVGASSEFWA
jgi:VIT1/CCC1 family predicted Fe2+/Mn2+ transporter